MLVKSIISTLPYSALSDQSRTSGATLRVVQRSGDLKSESRRAKSFLTLKIRIERVQLSLSFFNQFDRALPLYSVL